jgi:O-antigen ligase
MVLETVHLHAQRVSRWSAIALGASIPVSTALDNVLLAVMLTAWALSGQIRETLKAIQNNRVLLTSTALFLLLALGTTYGEVSRQEALSSLSKYADLLYLPVFMMIFRAPGTRIHALHALACSLAGIIALSYLIRFGLLPTLPFIAGTIDSPTVFKLKLTHNLLVAYGAFLFVWLGQVAVNHRLRIIWYALALLAVLNVVLMVQGATGYLVLGALALLLGWQRLGWRGLVGAMLAVTVVLATILSVPNSFQDRVLTIQRELRNWNPADSARTSTGLRLEFYQNSLAIVARQPLTGVGTGGFPAAYVQQVQGAGKVETRNPHNEFLLIATQVGVIGVILLTGLLLSQWRLASRMHSTMDRGLARGLVLTMVIGCMLNSLLLDHTEGLFYAWLTGVLYGGLEYGPPGKSSATI